jgi:hypothetical protein
MQIKLIEINFSRFCTESKFSLVRILNMVVVPVLLCIKIKDRQSANNVQVRDTWTAQTKRILLVKLVLFGLKRVCKIENISTEERGEAFQSSTYLFQNNTITITK